MFKNCQEAQCAFSNLAVDLPSIKNEVSDIEKNFCVLYGKRKLDSVNDARFQIFCNKWQKERWKSVGNKSFDGSCMLPCKKVLTEKVKSTNFVARKLQILLIETTPIDWIEYAVLCM